MATAVKVGREASAHGTLAASLTSVPCNFSAKLNQMNKVLEEDRQGQDRHFQMVKGQAVEEWEVAESGIYHDTIGFWLMSAFALPTKTTVDTIFDNTFLFADDPPSLSLQWQQPRRYTQAFQSLWSVVDKMTISYNAEGELTYSASGIAMPETEITTITHSWSTARPMPVWGATVLLNNVALTKLVSGSFTITRNRKPFWVLSSTQAPGSMNIGARTVEFDMTIDFSTKTEYDLFKTAAIVKTADKGLEIKWADTGVTIGTTSNPEFTVHLGSIAPETGEIDTGGDLPLVKLTGKAVYNSTDTSTAKIVVRSSKDYTT